MDDGATILCGTQKGLLVLVLVLLHLLQSLVAAGGDNSKLETSTMPVRDTTGSSVQTMLIYSLVVVGFIKGFWIIC